MGLILVEVLLTTSEKLKVLYIVCSLYGVDTLLLPRSSQIAFHFNNFNIVPRIVVLISIQFSFFSSTNRICKGAKTRQFVLSGMAVAKRACHPRVALPRGHCAGSRNHAR